LASRFKGLIWHSGLAAALLLAGAPLAAQDNSTTTEPPPATAGNIGPRELSNFSLNGRVTRPAVSQPAVPPPATADREPGPRASTPADSIAPRPAPVRREADARPSQPRQGLAIDPISTRPSLRGPGIQQPATAAPASPRPLSPPLPAVAPSGFSPLPWIAGLFLLVAGVVIYFGLQRRGQRYAAPGISEFMGQAPEPQPMPAPLPPAVSPTPPAKTPTPTGAIVSGLRAPSAPPGIVSASLRPWIELELEPSQAMLTDDHAAIAFDVTLFNSGSAPARDVAVEACLINAGQQQDVQLTEFYTTPGQVRDKIPAVAPLARVTLKSAVRLPRSAVHEYEVEGRKLFMPMVAVNSRYRWSSGEGQSAASFMVGRAADERAKLAPLRVDQGARGWKGLAARRYEKGIRV
jgi:hypothetical protein